MKRMVSRILDSPILSAGLDPGAVSDHLVWTVGVSFPNTL